MGIIVYNGDSFTYGDELGGSRSSELSKDSHHHHTFAYKLSSLLEKKYNNLAQNGSSNMKIFRRTINFLQKNNKNVDLLVIIWSGWGRFEICEPYHLESDKQIHIPQECNMNQIIPSHKSNRFIWKIGDDSIPERRDILKLYTENILTMQTQILHSLVYMQHIQWLSDVLNIKIIQGIIHPDLYKNILSTLKVVGFEEYKNEVIGILQNLRPECKIGLGSYKDIYTISKEKYTIKPMGHPDENAHTEFSQSLYHIIKEKEWFDVID